MLLFDEQSKIWWEEIFDTLKHRNCFIRSHGSEWKFCKSLTASKPAIQTISNPTRKYFAHWKKLSKKNIEYVKDLSITSNCPRRSGAVVQTTTIDFWQILNENSFFLFESKCQVDIELFFFWLVGTLLLSIANNYSKTETV